MTVADLLSERCALPGDRLIEGRTGDGVTWRQVAEQARRWQQSGLKGPVGLVLADPVAMAANFVAALAAGVIVAPLDPAAPPAERRASLHRLGLSTLVVDPGGDGGGAPTWYAGRHDLRPQPASPRGGQEASGPAVLPPVPTGVAAILASSGTTGHPKIVPLTGPQLLATAAGVARELDLSPDDRGYSPLPLFHINGLVVGVLSALVAGSSLVVERRFSRRSFWDTVESRSVTWLNLVPAIISLVEPVPAPPRVRLARSASAPLAGAARDRFERGTGVPVVETYGMTEVASQITANRLGSVRPGSVGRPVDIELRVTGQRVQVRGERVTPVYWRFDGGAWSHQPAAGEDGWLDTGDLGRLDADGFLYLFGRDGDVINRGGEKVNPREVEEVLMADPRVAVAVVVGRPHPDTGSEPVAFVVPAPGPTTAGETLEADLLERCGANLSRYKRPVRVVVAESLPAGPTGKTKRSAVAALAASLPPHPAY